MWPFFALCLPLRLTIAFFSISAGVCCSDNCRIHILSLHWMHSATNLAHCQIGFYAPMPYLGVSLTHIWMHSPLSCFQTSFWIVQRGKSHMQICFYLNIQTDVFRRRWLMCTHCLLECWQAGVSAAHGGSFLVVWVECYKTLIGRINLCGKVNDEVMAKVKLLWI